MSPSLSPLDSFAVVSMVKSCDERVAKKRPEIRSISAHTLVILLGIASEWMFCFTRSYLTLETRETQVRKREEEEGEKERKKFECMNEVERREEDEKEGEKESGERGEERDR